MYLFKQKPEYQKNTLIFLDKTPDSSKLEYFLITSIRWTRPQGSTSSKKEWVYDGLILVTENNQISVTGEASGVPERDVSIDPKKYQI